MRKLLAKGLVIIIDAGLLVLADLIMKRSKRNGNFHGLHRGRCGRPADDLRGSGHSLHPWPGLIRVPKHGHSKS